MPQRVHYFLTSQNNVPSASRTPGGDPPVGLQNIRSDRRGEIRMMAICPNFLEPQVPGRSLQGPESTTGRTSECHSWGTRELVQRLDLNSLSDGYLARGDVRGLQWPPPRSGSMWNRQASREAGVVEKAARSSRLGNGHD